MTVRWAMSTSIRNAIKSCQRTMELLGKTNPETVPPEKVLEVEEKMKKIVQVLSEHDARSLWLQTREGQVILRRIEAQALKITEVLENITKEEQGIHSSSGRENRFKSRRRAKIRVLENGLKKLGAHVEELKSEIEKRTYYVT